MKGNSKYIKQVENCLIAAAERMSDEELKRLASYIGTKHRVLGVSTLNQKLLARKKYDLTIENDQLLLLLDDMFSTSGSYEVKNAALNILEAHFKSWNKEELLAVIPSWVNYVDNWAHSDFLSKFYSKFLGDEQHRTYLLNLLKEWNKDKNPWKRRQSMVALIYPRAPKNPLPFKTIISFVKPHLTDQEYFVQKGVGWALRECYSLYPKLTFDFINEHFDKVSSTAFTAACEKMTVAQKEHLKRKRKLHRTKKK
jgi:3-methyladenine DNA glycosylase AlkD